METSGEPTSIKPIAKWSDMGLKSNCPDSDLRSQFTTIRPSLVKCLGLQDIQLPDKFVFDQVDPSTDRNVACALAANWDSCWHFLEGMSCLEADSRSLLPPNDSPFAGLEFERHFYGHEAMFDDHQSSAQNNGLSSLTVAYKARCAGGQMPSSMHGHGDELMADWMQDVDGDQIPQEPGLRDME